MRRIEWVRQTKVPRCVAAVLDGLRFGAAAHFSWPDADGQEWDRAIYYLNRNQLTLIANLPPHLQTQVDGFRRANSARLSRLRAATDEVIAELRRAGIETALLKGFARAGEYLPDPDARMHYDIDVYCPTAAHEAASVLRGIGYEPIAGVESDAAGHLVPLARPTSWKWRDDFFDSETPVHVELHQLLWVPRIECFPFSGLEEFWTRRENELYCTLSRHDTLAYRCLHLLRHLLRGDTRASLVYEIAYFLHQNRFDDAFWRVWQSLHPQDLQHGQAVCFALAQRSFGCEMHAVPRMAAEGLSERILEWMEHNAASPVESFFIPAKHELGLHFALIDAFADSASAKFRIALRRLLPLHHTPRMWEHPKAYAARLSARAIYHARALAPTLSKMLTIRR